MVTGSRPLPRNVAWAGLLVVGLMAFGAFGVLAVEGAAAPPKQPTPFLTPTPGPDGRIIYIAQEGDSLWRIAAIAGLSLEELMAMNGIQPGDFLTPGTRLELGRAGPALATGEAGGVVATPTEAEPTPTPSVSTGEICVLLFEDVNGNGRLEDGEPALAGGQISIADASGALAGELSTQSLDLEVEPFGHCFEDLASGAYNVSAAVPPGYNPTTGLNLPVNLEPGDVKYLQFGAQASSSVAGAGGSEIGVRSTLLGAVGILMLVAAGGLGYYAARMSRRGPASLR